VRPAREADVPALVELFHAYMRETFKAPWRGSAEALRRDGLGREFSTHVAVGADGGIVGLVAWTRSYDVHHCVAGGYLLDLYVVPEARGRGVAAALACSAAAGIRRAGGAFVKGQAVEERSAQRLYSRIAMRFDGADCIVGGRAFRRLAELAGRPAREVALFLPERSWNHEP